MAEDMMNVSVSKGDMVRMFGLGANYTVDELKKAYKSLVIKHHPDKTLDVSTTPTFQLITSCFKTLYNDLIVRAEQKEYMQLKSGFETERTKYKYANPLSTNAPKAQQGGGAKGEAFNVKLFNELFSQVRVKDVNDDGYEAWQQDDNSLKEKNNNTIVKYVEPKPMVSMLGKTQFAELGAGRVKDFGAPHVMGGLVFSDLRVAHTTDRLVDEDKVAKRKEYKNVQQLEIDRAAMPTQMSEDELRVYLKHKAREEQLEKQRLQRLAARDNKIEKVYERNHLLIANRLNK